MSFAGNEIGDLGGELVFAGQAPEGLAKRLGWHFSEPDRQVEVLGGIFDGLAVEDRLKRARALLPCADVADQCNKKARETINEILGMRRTTGQRRDTVAK